VKSLAQPDARAEIIARVHHVRPDSVGKFGVLTAPEMIVHCVICLEAGLGMRHVSPAETFMMRHVVKYVALYMPTPWPPGLKTRPEMDVRRMGNGAHEFVSDVAKLVQRLEEFGTRHLTTSWARHPMFGAMSESEWKRWGYLHTDHHLKQFSA
jgi:hypothetical protein